MKISMESASLSYPLAKASVELVKRHRAMVSWYHQGELLWQTGNVDAFKKLHSSVKRTTILSSKTTSIASPEHLAPVFALWNQYSFDIHLEQDEVPMLDGSALAWFHAIRSMAKTPQALGFYDVPLHEEWEIPGGFVKIRENDTFEVEYSLDNYYFKDSSLVSIYGPEDLYPILQARSFIFLEDYQKAKKAGLLKGSTHQNGLLLESSLLEPINLLHGAPLRHPQEILYHKILDLIGDICLHTTFLPKLKIQIHNGGHTSHHQILQRLLCLY
ncbi:MAG: UDP-3-O-acyl-N-acetylglucosamine deacetylase [Fibrobacter sp.]|nr:UDP-3-O-acyl-N-acetylglucosamine deacetylase [Fibrobacter sp.]